MLYGLLVDLIPFGKRIIDPMPKWVMGPGGWWGDGGNREIFSQAAFDRWQQERQEEVEQGKVSGISFGIQTKDGTPIGDMGINFMSPTHRAANLGAMIGDPNYWGGGYGTDALTLLIDYAFNWLDLRRVWLNTMGINARVIRQMEKVGFTLEGRQRGYTFVDGTWVDMLCYGLLREEWPGRETLIEKLGLQAKKE